MTLTFLITQAPVFLTAAGVALGGLAQLVSAIRGTKPQQVK